MTGKEIVEQEKKFNKVLHVRVDEAMRLNIERLSKRFNVSPSDLIRISLMRTMLWATEIEEMYEDFQAVR